MRTPENQLPTGAEIDAQHLLILEECRSDGEFKDLRNAVLDMYEASLSDEPINCTAISRRNNFYYFKTIFNVFSRLHAIEQPEDHENMVL
ncbi:hypothetical protein [Winogradskyella sp.]|uniref:hypothetical protein n=1 Tax=Winogradskyella sp. TaxID=1883156 RepID=UPI003BAC2C70